MAPMRRRYRSGNRSLPLLPQAYFGLTDTQGEAQLPLLHAQGVSRSFQLILLHLHSPVWGRIVGGHRQKGTERPETGNETGLSRAGIDRVFGFPLESGFEGRITVAGCGEQCGGQNARDRSGPRNHPVCVYARDGDSDGWVCE